ncbi:MAG: tRNA (adenosine(37)-N6)-threonylcarbamoyltransferase complex ATPase subunit type 1 TsaE [Calditrichaeota bacterium]|nr:MAG: tRNA (adenosine(37)-N6)-threonylcarbamoyltransferase complex ATPase subunit type 1 TsaE [Calditrichota bacterium]
MPEIRADNNFQRGVEHKFEVKNENETNAVASEFILNLKPGDTVALFGDLGAGKTAMVRAMSRSLGYNGFVNSPTFTLLNIYPTIDFEIYHFDFYRIEFEEEASGIGFEEYVENDGICFIEWPEKVSHLLPKERYEIHLSVPDYINNPEARTIRISKN